jgi:plastocyanin
MQKSSQTLAIGFLFVMIVVVGVASWVFIRPKVTKKVSITPSITNPEGPAVNRLLNGKVPFVNIQAPQSVIDLKGTYPKDREILAGAPKSVMMLFNNTPKYDSLKITLGSTEMGTGAAEISKVGNSYILHRALNPTAPDGVYVVTYSCAKVPPVACKPMQFQFAIDWFGGMGYPLLTAKDSTITIKDGRIDKPSVQVKPGVKVTWSNADPDQKIVSGPQDYPPYFPRLTSPVVKQNASYSYTFSEPGAYPYYLAGGMDRGTGIVVVTP